MDERRFDELAKKIGDSINRKSFVRLLAALAAAGLPALSGLPTLEAQKKTPRHGPCRAVLTATGANGQHSRQQYIEPESVYVKGRDFPRNVTLSFTVFHRPEMDGTILASGSFNSGRGNFGATFVWDGANAFPGDEAYRVL